MYSDGVESRLREGLGKSKADRSRFFLHGLARTKSYALTFQDRPEQNTRKTGADLMDQGFDLTMTGQNVSEIVWVEQAR